MQPVEARKPETAQTMDYAKDPQEYGGFSLLKEEERQKIVDLVFGDDGLRVGLLKMFYDPFHQTEPGGKYDHETSTRWLRYFAREGLKKTRASGRDLTVIFGEHKSAGIDALRTLRPELHAWVTSTSWSQMDAKNIKEHHGNIYTAKVNGCTAQGAHAFRTTEDEKDKFADVGRFEIKDGALVYEAPAGSVTTFFSDK